jgi:hypothetical protein
VSQSPTWNDVEREESGVLVVLPLSAARSLRTALPRLLELVENGGARSPADRQHRRDTHLALKALAGALDQSLRPLDPLDRPAASQDG